MSLRSVAIVLLAACSDDVAITRLPGSPSATRALTFFDDGQPIAIGGESPFGLAYLQTPDGDGWTRAVDVPAFDAHAKLMRGNTDIFAIGETQVHRWERANAGGGFAWRSIAIPLGITPNTAFGIDDLGHIYALELQPDGGGAVLAWRTDTNRWQEIPTTRPIGVGATNFTVSRSGNSIAWSTPTGVEWVDRIAGSRASMSCEAADLGACAATVRGLGFHGDEVLNALVCDDEINGLRSVVSRTFGGSDRVRHFPDENCQAMHQIDYGTTLVVGDSLYVSQSDDGLVPITEADPAQTYMLLDPSTAYGFGDGIYKIDF